MGSDSRYTCDICGESFERKFEIGGHLRGHQVSVPADTIISELKRLAQNMGRPPKQSEVKSETEFTFGAVESTFGSWELGLEAAGLKMQSNEYTDSAVLSELNRVAAQIGHSPSKEEFKIHGEMSPDAVRYHFDSWNEGLSAAQLDTTFNRKATKEEVITAIQELATELGRPPTAVEMERHGDWSVKVAQRRFGQWSDALRCAGFEPNKQWDIGEEQLHSEIDRLVEQLGHTPSSIEMQVHGRHSVGTYLRRYETWKNAIEAAGYEHRGVPSGPEHHGWKGGYGDISYGPNWYQQRKQALERDGFECQMPGCLIDRETHYERWDRDLNVHHIMPLGTFINADGVLDYERSNQLKNLITLCQRHHQVWEKFSPLQPDIR